MAIELEIGENTYISLSDAEDYMSNRLFVDEWTQASDNDKTRALMMATKKIDNLMLRGEKTVSTQTLQFPRALFSEYLYRVQQDIGMVHVSNSYFVVESEISDLVKYACCEEALALLKFGNSERSQMQSQGVKSYSISNLSETFNASSSSVASRLLSSDANLLLRHYILTTAGVS